MTRYWRLTLDGEPSPDEIQAAIGDASLVRVHSEKGYTQVYFSTEDDARDERDDADHKSGRDKRESVELDEVLRI